MRRTMLTALILCGALGINGCAGPRTVVRTETLRCPQILPPLVCNLAACPEAETLETVGATQEAYLRCAASAACLAEYAGNVKRLHDGCPDPD